VGDLSSNIADQYVDENVREGRADKVAFVDAVTDESYTYGDVLRHTNQVANALRALGVRREERVMLLLQDTPEFVWAFFGTARIGAIPVPVNTLLTPADYAYLLNDCRARVAIVSPPLLPQVEAVRDQLRYLEHVVTTERDQAPVPTLWSLLEGQPAEAETEWLSPDDAAFWLYSSGTTGFPKGAVHRQQDMRVAVEGYAGSVLGIGENDVCFSVAKLFFAYGLGNSLYFPMSAGATSVLYRGKADPHTFYGIIEKYGASLFFCVPTAYAGLLAVEDAATRYKLDSLRLCISAGEALPAPLYERWKERFGVEILDGIGSTEMLHIFLSNRPGDVRPGSSGRRVPGYDVKIVDEDGQPVVGGEIGDLLVSGDSALAYYWNKREQTRKTIEGSWVRTGDKYREDEDGYFWYQGRSDDMLKAGGIWVSPTEVEGALMEHEAVLECAVVGAEDAEGLVKPKAYVVLNEGHVPGPETAEALQAFVKQRLAVYKYPRWVEFLPELPKTATGKIQRYKLRG
jgi:benzoate-CoA ligase